MMPCKSKRCRRGDDGVLHQMLHLARHTGQGNDRLVKDFDDERRRSANRILDGDCASGDVRLTAVVLGGLAVKTSKARLNLLPKFGMKFGFDAHS